MAALLRERRAQQESAADEVAEDKARYAQLNRERASVEQRIAARIAKAKAEARAKARAEARARARATLARKRAAERAAARAAAQARRADGPRAGPRSQAAPKRPEPPGSEARAQSPATRKHGSRVVPVQQRPRRHNFSFPVSGRSPRRTDPVPHDLRYWKLHAGTDSGKLRRGDPGAVLAAGWRSCKKRGRRTGDGDQGYVAGGS